MKFKAPPKQWTKAFAWWPVRMTGGEHDVCCLVWLQFYVIKMQRSMAGWVVERMTLRDAECHRQEWERIRREIDEEYRIGG